MSDLARPSECRVDDLAHVAVGELDFPIDDFSASDMFNEIVHIVGSRNRVDCLHIDSAYKSGCRCFFSRDKTDILSKRQWLEPLLGMRFFHPDDDWVAFLALLSEDGSTPNPTRQPTIAEAALPAERQRRQAD